MNLSIMTCMSSVRRFLALAIALVLLAISSKPVFAQTDDVQFFPETGHNAKGEFLRFYQRTTNAEILYGYPITEQFVSKDGRTVQYFQRARFELRKDLFGRNHVQLSQIGRALYQPGGQLDLGNSFGCQRFFNGYRVCFAFLDFFKDNGGVEQFGNPISPFEYHENLIVQYFEKARFEWRADRAEGQRVVVSELGRNYFDLLAEDSSQLTSLSPLDATINSVLSLRVRAYVEKSILLSSGQQTVYVIAQSQTLQAVADATGKATIHWPDGSTEDYFFTTNQAGVGSFMFQVASQKQGSLVPIDILVTYQGLIGRTSTSFRIWF